jgi:murein DD-endopeptidase MepM/ murein hydrolase activator NlpD
VVEKGDTVGEVGATGRATGPHLHFSVKVGEASTNPVSFARLPL